ncbi:MAG: hypothetical protein WDN28_31445 [Chthoniobacter sp.]
MGVPTAGDDAEFDGNALTYTVSVSGNAIQNVSVTASDVTFNLGGNLTISNALTMGVHGFIRVTGSGTLTADTINADQFTIGSGTTVTTSSFAALTLTVTGATFNSGNYQHASAQISQGSTVTSTTVLLDSAFGPSTLDASSWKVSGLFEATNAYALTIKNGGTLTSGSGLTKQSGGVVIDGAGSSWKITNDATVSSSSGANGGLEVERGGVATIGGNLFINNGGAVFGNFSDTTGASRIDVTGKVDLGSAGSIYLGEGATLTSAGVVTRASAFDGGSAAVGATLDIAGTWTNTGGFVIGESGQNTVSSSADLRVSSGGQLTTSADLIVGQGAAFSTLLVGNDAVVKNVNGVLAQNAGSRTDASVGGTNSQWTNSGTLTVADAGTANLEISGGGTVTDTAATVGNQAGSKGFVSVMNGGTWTVNGNLVIGAAGMSQGTVTDGFGGHLTVTGSTLTLGRDAGSVGSLSLDNGFALGTTFTFTGDLEVGLAGKGTLEILDGFQLDQGAKSLVLGGQATANGTLRVSDDIAGSFNSPTRTTYKSTNLTVGSLGTGTLDIENNGFVQTTGNAVVGEMAGSNGMATITGTGSLWQVDGNLVVGQSGSADNRATGVVVVADSGELKVNGAQLVLGQETGSQGTLVVDGANSKVTGTGATNLEIGRHGIGTLQLQNGAQFTIASATLGVQNDGAGRITVSGAPGGNPTSLTVNGSLTVGGASPGVSASIADPTGSMGGELTISGGAHVTLGSGGAGGLIIGRDAGATGQAELSGIGSLLQINGTASVIVGDSGTGTFNISNGATFTGRRLDLGGAAGSQGTVRVTGSGGTNDATLTLESLIVGNEGTGTFILENGGQLGNSVLSVTVAQSSSGVGNITVDGVGSLLKAGLFDLGNAGLFTTTGGDGIFSILNGGKAEISTITAGFKQSAKGGTIIVSGTSSNLKTTGSLLLYSASSGMPGLSVQAGGSVAVSDSIFVGSRTGNAPMALIEGQNSTLTATGGTTTVEGGLVVDQGASATLQELDLGSADGSAKVTIGGNAGTTSTVTVTGPLNLGSGVLNGNTTGTLDIGAGGQLIGGLENTVSGSHLMVHDEGALFSSKSGLTLFDSQLEISVGGSVNVHDAVNAFGSSISLFNGDAQLNANFIKLDGSSTLTGSTGGTVSGGYFLRDHQRQQPHLGPGRVNIGATLGQGPLGTVFVGIGGSLINNGVITADVSSQFGGTVSGSGTIKGLFTNAGTAAPGNSPRHAARRRRLYADLHRHPADADRGHRRRGITTCSM